MKYISLNSCILICFHSSSSRRRQPEYYCLLQHFLQDPVLLDTFLCTFELVLLGKLIPNSTASVERCFSLMDSICTVNRDRLSQETLTALMLICREGSNALISELKMFIFDNFKRMKRREILLWKLIWDIQ